MACEIHVTSVTGIVNPGNTVPTSIRVTGTANECTAGTVDVRLTCSGGSPLSLTVPIDAAGAWIAVFTAGANQCACTKPFEVIASCSNNPDCFERVQGVLQCETGPGPCGDSTGDLTVVVTGCAGGGSTATATFTFTINPPLPNCTYQWNFGDGSPVQVTNVPTVTHTYANPGTFTAVVGATCVTPTGDCFIRDSVQVVIPPCNVQCPQTITVNGTVTGCAQPGFATGTFNAVLVPPVAGCEYRWDFGDGSPQLITNVPNANHNYTTAGNFGVSVVVFCPFPTFCGFANTSVTVLPCCPVITMVSATLGANECAGGTNTATVSFSAITNPPAAPGNYTLNFGDGSPQVTNPGPNASHDYATAGTFTATVTVNRPGCPSSSGSTNVTVPACGGGGNGGNGGGGGFGCLGARIIMTIAAILAIAAASIALCIPPAATFLFTAAAIFAGIALIAGILFAIFCPKPCAWGILFTWQVLIGVGLILLCFTTCCPAFWALGSGFTGIGLGVMAWWKQRCDKSWCEVAKELVIAISGVVIPLLGWLGVVAALAACINPVITAALAVLAGALAVTASQC
ncbi:MAG TPA: PKD domain-containing protein [Thermoanaerobaculia bacterium]|nr:PKD domain-containing protein [Thermoanaerobaculia bacterium]